MDEEELEEEREGDGWITSHPSVPIHRIDFLIVGIGFVRQVVEAAHNALGTIETLVCGHANHEIDQTVFRDQARQQIETLTEE